MKHYRIILEHGAIIPWRYIVQRWRWWFPLWVSVQNGQLFSLESAEKFIKNGCPNERREWLRENGEVIKTVSK